MPTPAVYRSPRALAVAATTLLAVCGVEALVNLGTAFRLHLQVGDLAAGVELSGGSSPLDTANLYDNIRTLELVTTVATAVVFIVWFHRVRVNAEVFAPNGHRFRRGWAIGGWFTPVVALWFPRQIAGDTWCASARPDASGVRPTIPSHLVNLWWATFLLTNVLDRIGSQYLDSAQYADSYQEALAWLIASDAVEVAAAVFAVLVVQRLTAMQEERFAESAAPVFGAYGGTVRG
ncbi:DUF4328 domain-containing protein [Kitasatospora sp. NPDC004799]|uniref:DUF4328 domain-containing protein n=1 Tax=Kitasatospora sp. NPDC004799 TaxID=3154460 RepID=UPI0033ACF454